MPFHPLSSSIAVLLRVLVLVAVCASSLAHAADERNLAAKGEKRIALVIGNSAYPGAPLKNPVNDARDMAAALRKLGFDVIEKTDITQKDMNRAIAQFGEKLRADTVALFYYAGHGMQVKGKNYLLPIDAQIASEASARAETVDVDTVMDQLAVSTMNIVILDACRNNPFERKFRSTGGGLAQMDAPRGSLIAYATAPGKVASDGDGKNGLYTQELLKHIQTPGLPLEAVFKRVRNGVVQGSGEAQTPWEASSLTGDFYFQAGSGAASAPATQVASLGAQVVGGRSREQIEDELWDAIKGSEKASVFEAYQREYPNGRYLAQARVRLTELKDAAKPGAAKPAVPPAPTFAATSSDPDTALWSEVQKGNSADDYDVYLKQYPKGKYVALAKQRLQKLKDEAKQKADAEEQSVWQAAESSPSGESYAAYLASYPKGKFAVLAQARADKLKREAADMERLEAARQKREQVDAALREEAEHWRKAENATDSATVQAYLDKYPAGRNAAQARIKLAELKKKEAEGPRIGAVFKDCADCPEMVTIPAGSFEMGGDEKDEKPVHTVRIGKPLAMGKTEVTRGQFAAFVKDSGHNAGNECWTFEGGKWEKRSGRNWQNPGLSQADSHPAVCVNWDDAKAYVAWLTRKTGKSYRLPTEAEWEYACRAGGRHKYCGGDSEDSVAWYKANSGEKTHAVAGKQANAWGLHDMSGNVWEWAEDCWNDSYNGAPTDGSAWTGGQCTYRVLRGGSWDGAPDGLRAAYRINGSPGIRINGGGFRVAR